MTRRGIIFAAVMAASVVLAGSLLMMGTGTSGLGAAARNTARFSGILFAIALLARSPRFEPLFQNRWNLFWAFIAAHGVHFTAVMGVVLFDVASPLHQLSPMVLGTLASGFGLVLATALTAGKASAPFRSRAHSFLFYVVAISFGVAFGSRATQMPASAAVLVLLLLASVIRIIPVRQADAASVSA